MDSILRQNLRDIVVHKSKDVYGSVEIKMVEGGELNELDKGRRVHTRV
jgi:hypothetical protein